MSGFRVTPEQLQSASGRVRSGAGSIQSELSGLAGGLAPLGAEWAGSAQARFQELWAEWQRSAEGLNTALSGIADLLSQAGTAYASAEAEVTRSFAR